MIEPLVGAERLRVTRIFPATRERVFKAWTEPQELREWFGVAEGYTTPIAEVDLRVGGTYRLGMRPPGSTQVLIAQGIYREIVRPEKLVFTWRWETPNSAEPHTLVTLEFLARGESTEIILTHEGFADEAQRNQHQAGWQGCLARLAAMLNERR